MESLTDNGSGLEWSSAPVVAGVSQGSPRHQCGLVSRVGVFSYMCREGLAVEGILGNKELQERELDGV